MNGEMMQIYQSNRSKRDFHTISVLIEEFLVWILGEGHFVWLKIFQKQNYSLVRGIQASFKSNS